MDLDQVVSKSNQIVLITDGKDVDTTIFAQQAIRFIESNCLSDHSCMNDDLLCDIAVYVTLHYYTMIKGGHTASFKVDKVSRNYDLQVGTGLLSTSFGQLAVQSDCTGILVKTGRESRKPVVKVINSND